MPRIMPEPRYFSIPSIELGADVLRKRDVRDLVRDVVEPSVADPPEEALQEIRPLHLLQELDLPAALETELDGPEPHTGALATADELTAEEVPVDRHEALYRTCRVRDVIEGGMDSSQSVRHGRSIYAPLAYALA